MGEVQVNPDSGKVIAILILCFAACILLAAFGKRK